mmetsp:Transcript_70839/g.129614  ORF Transcript_70839/g.129614 Transcript_70839/m.129614 type:complete len:125 (+) Transcript_70839:51-425(+)
MVVQGLHRVLACSFGDTGGEETSTGGQEAPHGGDAGDSVANAPTPCQAGMQHLQKRIVELRKDVAALRAAREKRDMDALQQSGSPQSATQHTMPLALNFALLLQPATKSSRKKTRPAAVLKEFL